MTNPWKKASGAFRTRTQEIKHKIHQSKPIQWLQGKHPYQPHHQWSWPQYRQHCPPGMGGIWGWHSYPYLHCRWGETGKSNPGNPT